MKWADKPGSVVNDHSSRRTITRTLKRPTRIQHGPCLRIPIWSCFWWGLPCHELLPAMRCALTAPFHPYLQFLPKKKPHEGGLLSAALSVGSRRPGVTWHPALWSPDFPPLFQSRRPPQQRSFGSLRGSILTNKCTNCSCFFDQSVFDTFPAIAPVFQHGWDHAEYSLPDRITDTAVYHDARHIRYTAPDWFHKSARPWKWPHSGTQVHRHRS